MCVCVCVCVCLCVCAFEKGEKTSLGESIAEIKIIESSHVVFQKC